MTPMEHTIVLCNGAFAVDPVLIEVDEYMAQFGPEPSQVGKNDQGVGQ